MFAFSSQTNKKIRTVSLVGTFFIVWDDFVKSAIPGWYQYLYGLNMTFDIPMEKHRKLI